MLEDIRNYVSGEDLELTEKLILERKYELLFFEGKVNEMVKPPFDVIFRAQPFPERLKVQLKRCFPRLHDYYRKKKGFY